MSLMPQIQWITAWSLRRSRLSSCSLGPYVLLPYGAKLNECKPRTPCQVSWVRGIWRLGQAGVSWTFPRPYSIWQQWHCHGPTGAQHITKVAEGGFHFKHGAVDIPFSHNSVIDGPRLTLTPGADIVWVFDWSLSHATARLFSVDIFHVSAPLQSI